MDIVNTRGVNPCKDLKESIQNALSDPIDSIPFAKFFHRNDEILIVVSDKSRYTGAEKYLSILIDCLKSIGINEDKIKIIFALGIHSSHNPQEREKILGEKVYRRIDNFDHNCLEPKGLLYLGDTRRGTKVILNKILCEVDKVLLTGAIDFHYFAGFTGGRKGIMPGLASAESATHNHLLALDFSNSSDFFRHPKARVAIMDENPVNEDMEEAAKKVNNVFLFNTVLDIQGKIGGIFCGDLISAHRRGAEFVLERYGIERQEKADLVIASCGGFPKDINLIQIHKTIDNAFGFVKEGGVIVVLGEASQGLGYHNFLDWFQNDDPLILSTRLKNHYEIYGQTALSLLYKTKKARIILVSQLKREEVERASLIPAESLEDGLKKAKRFLCNHPSTYIIPYGTRVCLRN